MLSHVTLIIFLVVFLKSVAEDVCPVCRSGGAPQAAHFANVEDMLFEVFRCEETDTFDRISIRQFLKVRMGNEDTLTWEQTLTQRLHTVRAAAFTK